MKRMRNCTVQKKLCKRYEQREKKAECFKLEKANIWG